VADQPKRLCIVSRDRLRSGDFVAVLRASLRPEDQLQIIMNRRHGGSSRESDLREDRRRQRQVDLALEANGFAIVPASVDPPKDRTPLSLLLPEAPIAHLSPEYDEDEERLESILRFKRRRSGRRIPKLLAVLIGVTLGAFVLSPPGQNLGKSLMSRVFQGSSPPSGGPGQPPVQTNEDSTLAQSRAVTEKPAITETPPARAETPPPARPSSESPSAGGPANTKSVPPRAADRLTATPRETSTAPKVTGTTSRGPGTGAPPTEKATPPRFAGSPRVELVREPVSLGWGESYAVRLLDPAGQPMAGADVLLVAHMEDGTVENIPMGALPEPGTYRGTVPTGRSAPVDLRVRVSTGDKRVEVPVRR